MENKTFIGVYHSESEVIAEINNLKTQGFTENDIYVIAKDKDDISMVRGRTNADVQTTEGSWMDRFMAFMSGEEPVRGAFRHMGLSDAEADRYYTEVENGGILLYVDRDYGDLYDEDHTAATVDPTLRGNLFVADDRRLDDNHDHAIQEEETLQLHEERLNVNKERVQTGEVHVEKEVIQEEQVIDVPVQREEVFVERRPVAENDLTRTDDDLTAFDDRNAFEDDGETIRVPVTEERVEVTKKPVVTEEIVIGKRTVQDTETVRDTVRREEAHVNEDRTKRTDRDLL